MASAKYITKTCVICGKEYQGIPQSLYCSKECREKRNLKVWHDKHPLRELIRVCVVCGKEFSASGNQRTCSQECRVLRHRENWNSSYHNRMTNDSKKERRRNLSHLDYLEHKEEKQSRKHGLLIQKKRELAQSLQTAQVIENNNGNIKQDYLESLSIRRVSRRGCECLKCGNKFNVICAENTITYLNRLVASGKSPCPYCGEAPTGATVKRHSKPEYEIQKLFPNFTVHGYHPDWMGGKMEIDLYDPVAKVGLEYHGIWAHSTATKSNKEATRIHEHKANLCDANGVQLIQLYETEWLQKRDIVMDKLNAIFHKDMKRVYARKLKVVLMNDPVNRKSALEFLDRNHIQGKASSQWAVGLCDGIELVAVCTFKYGTAYANGGQAKGTECYWELNRYATKLGYSVVGGLSRCIKSFVRNHPEVHTIVSFADRRWTSPIRSAYSSSGFVEKERIRPNYMYSDLNAMHPLRNKQYMRKSSIAKRGESCYSPDKTETEMSRELGFYKIYDAGKIRYEMSV